MRVKVVAGTGLTSKALCWWGNGFGGYSHAAAVLPSGELLDARYDHVGGQPPGVRIRPDGYEKWLRWQVIDIPSSAAQDAAWERYLRSQIGRPYDSRGILSFILGTQPADDGMWFCSALQAEALQKCGRMSDIGIPPQQVTPDGLAMLARAIGGKVWESFNDDD
ncbi:MAG TPA: hypothetical protein VN660_13745 [Steroidobacteraceae bacterium]|nr:hypothetical protein [Steroidobacteraceae bacterium]